ncbi:MAG: fumarate reductase/succinate dehydrogenase flavoprotein subunit [Acaryochloridaceae cyanobacterium SU_2_1]|nr:fumarate reductase/succinate dehydrogenase flavoprotein subunit [Acaryochloridaceae cyanobacterium SU_2_1]
MALDARIPNCPLVDQWTHFQEHRQLISPANKRQYQILVVGTGLAGASAAASLAEQGYQVKSFCIQDSPRRAHSIAAQGGINAAKNYANDGDSVWRLFYDTLKGGDYRSREANTYRLAQLSNHLIDQCVAQGVPFAREYSGMLANRSFGGVQVSRTFYARGQTGQQLLLGAYGAMMRMVEAGRIQLLPCREMLDLVVIEGRARGLIVRNLWTGELERHSGDAVLLCTGGYGNAFYLSTNGRNSNVSAAWRCHKKGAYFANPCYVQVHPTCIPASGDYQSKRTLMSESLRNDGRMWVPKGVGDRRPPQDIPEAERDYYLERKYPRFGNLVPRDLASRNAKVMTDEGRGVGETGLAVYLDFAEALARLGKPEIARRYGNLFEIYEQITGEDPYQQPMRIYPAVHYTMGGLWVDYHLMSTIPGLFVLGEANFSDHGANRLGASALMQGLADGYFIIGASLGNYLAAQPLPAVTVDHSAFEEAENFVQSRLHQLLNIQGDRTVMEFHRDLGQLLWDFVGISRDRTGLESVITQLQELRQTFWQTLKIPGEVNTCNKNLEWAGRVADFLELGELMARDALQRNESCGSHFRAEYQTAEGEAQRDDQHFAFVAAWEYQGPDQPPILHKEDLVFEAVPLSQRSYQ